MTKKYFLTFLLVLSSVQFVWSVTTVVCYFNQDDMVFNCTYRNGSDVGNWTLKHRVSPEDIFHIYKNVDHLIIEKQKIDRLEPLAFRNAGNLKVLNLGYSRIKELENDTFAGARKLEEVFLWGNEISYVDENAFRGLTNLRILELDKNKIVELRSKTFRDLINLKQLGLTSNQLEYLPKDLFEQNQKLEVLYLGKNRLQSIHYKMFSNLKNLWILFLDHNICVDQAYIKKFGDNESELKRLEDDLKKCSPCYDELLEIDKLKEKIAKKQRKIAELTRELKKNGRNFSL